MREKDQHIFDIISEFESFPSRVGLGGVRPLFISLSPVVDLRVHSHSRLKKVLLRGSIFSP